jgi:pimeloyl-ACP methyl ester carboxylesterase
LRDRPATVLNEVAFTAAGNEFGRRDVRALSDWMFYYDDVERDAIAACVPSPWRAESYPGAVLSCLTPGVVAPEAAAVDVPVLIGMGERDVVADPLGEPRAYLSAPSIDLYTCPRMGHMHNFASTREQLWQRLECWGDWVRCRTAQ